MAAEPKVLTVPATAVPPALTLNEVVVRLVGSMASEKFALIVVLSRTSVAESEGNTDDTSGAVVSGTAPVVKLQE